MPSVEFKMANTKKYITKNINKWKSEDYEDSDGDEDEKRVYFVVTYIPTQRTLSVEFNE